MVDAAASAQWSAAEGGWCRDEDIAAESAMESRILGRIEALHSRLEGRLAELRHEILDGLARAPAAASPPLAEAEIPEHREAEHSEYSSSPPPPLRQGAARVADQEKWAATAPDMPSTVDAEGHGRVQPTCAASLSDAEGPSKAMIPDVSEGGVAAHVRTRNSLTDSEDLKRMRKATQFALVAERGSTTMDLAPPSRCQRVTGSAMFEAFFACITILNAVLLGLQADHGARNVTEDVPIAYTCASVFFTVLFAFELGCNLWCQGRSFFTDAKNYGWNILDVILVASSLPEVVVLASDAVHSMLGRQSIGQIRLLRVLRVTRLIRIIRIARIVRFIRALRTLVYQVISTVKSLVWGLTLLVILMYGFGILFTQVATSLLADNQVDSDERLAINLFWSSTPRSMLTLWESVSGGVSWHDVVTPLTQGGVVVILLFCSYIAFTQLAVLNVLTGVFCQTAIESAQRDQDIVTAARLADKERYTQQLMDLFGEIDTDCSGTITILELKRHMNSEKVKAYFAALELDATDAWAFFKLIDHDRGNTIDLKEFVEGCMRIRGYAKGIDLHLLSNDQRRFHKRNEERMRSIEDQLVKMNQHFGVHYV
mmetsp:Transcript_88259/g.254688  ORF Transcript_88259/g.254688 Transcript_88259/m.254688 type:complete len:598 (+) Transcript_88259:74-1867(+)